MKVILGGLIMSHQCNKEDLIEYIRKDLHEIKSDVKVLLSFRYYIIGGATVVSAIVAFIIQLVY